MDDGCEIVLVFAGILIVAAVSIAIVLFIVLPLSMFLLVGIGAVGLASGMVVALRSFRQLMIEAHKTIE